MGIIQAMSKTLAPVFVAGEEDLGDVARYFWIERSDRSSVKQHHVFLNSMCHCLGLSSDFFLPNLRESAPRHNKVLQGGPGKALEFILKVQVHWPERSCVPRPSLNRAIEYGVSSVDDKPSLLIKRPPFPARVRAKVHY